MSEEDNLFGVPEDNDEEMLDANDEDDNMEVFDEDDDNEENEDDDNDENDEDGEDEDNDDNDEDNDEGDNDDDNENEDENDDENDENDDDENEENDDNEENEESENQHNHKPKPPVQDDETVRLSPAEYRRDAIAKAKLAADFDIVPSVAIPYSSQCQSLAFTDGPKWLLTGGEDGFIRKYDFFLSLEGKSPLTMAQRHNLVDTITKAGVISSYWENEQPMTQREVMAANPKIRSSDFATGSAGYEPVVSPVYALAAERNGLWCLLGVASGGISLYTMRYNEGNIHHYFSHGPKKRAGGAGPPSVESGHSDAVSVLRLTSDEKLFLSGSWDKAIRSWDLNTGACTRVYAGSSGQISNIQYRPTGLSDLVLAYADEQVPNGHIINKPDRNNNSDVDSLFGSDEEEEARKPERQPDSLSSKSIASDVVFMSSSMDGTINIWDARVADPVLRIGLTDGTPPWCMSSTWSNDGEYIYAGRRNSTVEEFCIKMPHVRSKNGTSKESVVPNVLKLLQFPKVSGPVSAVSTIPNDKFLLCGSFDNIRLYNLGLYQDGSATTTTTSKKQATPFLIIPGHHGGILSQLYCDETGRFMVSASGNRGWGHSTYTDTVLVYEVDFDG